MRTILSVVIPFCIICNCLLAQVSGISTARWISPYAAGATNEKTPCPILRSTFTVNGPVKAATVHVVGLGHYELYLNGKRVGTSLINQPWSQYNKTIYWQEFDISKLLRNGENVWGVMLGNSFWHVTAANDTGRYVKTDAMPEKEFHVDRGFFLAVHVTADARTVPSGPVASEPHVCKVSPALV